MQLRDWGRSQSRGKLHFGSSSFFAFIKNLVCFGGKGFNSVMVLLTEGFHISFLNCWLVKLQK